MNEVEDIPQWILNCPISANWLEFKGETYFEMLNYERSVSARRPMIDLTASNLNLWSAKIVSKNKY